MTNRGCFVTFEGGEGAGKSTLIDKIYDILFAQKLNLVRTREPGGTILGEEVRRLLLDHSKNTMSKYAELCLFLASRAQHIKEIILPALNSNKIVLCDRFNDSTVAYQGYARDIGINKVENYCSLICENLLPNITIYLDIDPKIGLQRVKKLPQKKSSAILDRIEAEHISFHQKIRDGFHKIAKKNKDRFFIIDASKSQEEVLKETIELIEKKLKNLNLI